MATPSWETFGLLAEAKQGEWTLLLAPLRLLHPADRLLLPAHIGHNCLGGLSWLGTPGDSAARVADLKAQSGCSAAARLC